jgi:Zn-dependent protease with chaperone function
MTLLLLLCGLSLLAIPAVVRPAGRRLRPSEWTKTCAGLLAVGWVVVEASLLLQAAPTLLGAAGLERLAELCEHALGPVAPGGPLLGMVAGGAATAVTLLAARSLLAARYRRRLVRVEAGIGWHPQVGGHELVVLPSSAPVAFSTAGRRGQVVVSQGLIAALSDAEVTAVLRHEVAHLHHRHQRYLRRQVGTPAAGPASTRRCCGSPSWPPRRGSPRSPPPGPSPNAWTPFRPTLPMALSWVAGRCCMRRRGCCLWPRR